MMRNNLFKGRERQVVLRFVRGGYSREDVWGATPQVYDSKTTYALVCYGSASLDPSIDRSSNDPDDETVRVFMRRGDIEDSEIFEWKSLRPGDQLMVCGYDGRDALDYTIQSIDVTQSIPGPYDVRIVAKKEVDDGV